MVVAQDVLEALSLDRILFVPARVPPHKAGRRISPAPIRLEMVRAVIQGNESFGVSEVELRRSGPSFTVDTLGHFREIHPEAEIFFILGADQAASFDTWEEPERVASLATLAVMNRAGIGPPPRGFLSVPVTRVDVSATEIRARVRAGRSIRYVVPDAVREIIASHRLYQVEP
jgi:nicotinate-nucleotide adenylyltransferase